MLFHVKQRPMIRTFGTSNILHAPHFLQKI